MSHGPAVTANVEIVEGMLESLGLWPYYPFLATSINSLAKVYLYKCTFLVTHGGAMLIIDILLCTCGIS